MEKDCTITSSLQNWIKRARRSSFSFFIIVSLWYNRDIKIGIYQAVNFENFFEKLLTPTQRNSLRYVYREEEMTMMTVNEVSKLTGVSTDAIQRVLSQESVDIRNLFLWDLSCNNTGGIKNYLEIVWMVCSSRAGGLL